ncbi:MAG: carboxypeptidase regulatory-like domain-containing protein [Bacteroidota bacterium]
MSKTFKYLMAISLVLGSVLFVNSHPKAEAQLLPTKLRVTVLDGNGNYVDNASVSLFASEDDYINSKDPLKLDRTDKKGRVTFKDLGPKSYYIDARKGDKNNDGRGSKTDKLQEGRINKVNVVIE